MKVVVTGSEGQLARSLAEKAQGWPAVELVTLGRPGLDLEAQGSAFEAIVSAAPDVVINTAAYTAVDQAEDLCEEGSPTIELWQAARLVEEIDCEDDD